MALQKQVREQTHVSKVRRKSLWDIWPKLFWRCMLGPHLVTSLLINQRVSLEFFCVWIFVAAVVVSPQVCFGLLGKKRGKKKWMQCPTSSHKPGFCKTKLASKLTPRLYFNMYNPFILQVKSADSASEYFSCSNQILSLINIFTEETI